MEIYWMMDFRIFRSHIQWGKFPLNFYDVVRPHTLAKHSLTHSLIPSLFKFNSRNRERIHQKKEKKASRKT